MEALADAARRDAYLPISEVEEHPNVNGQIPRRYPGAKVLLRGIHCHMLNAG
jgi:hypothetical protein